MYREFVTVSKYCVLYFSPAQEKLSFHSVERFHSEPRSAESALPPECVASLASVRVAIRGATRRCPVSATGLKSCLQSWIFHWSISQNRRSVFASPDGDRVAAFPFTTPHRLTFSLTFSHSACPHGTTSPVAIAQFFSTSSSSPKVHIFVQTLVRTIMEPDSN